MKILFVYGSLGLGGAERVIVNLSNYINNDVSILIFSQENSAYELSNNVKLIRPYKTLKKTTIKARVKWFFYRLKFLSNNIKNYDVIVCFDIFMALQCKFMKYTCKVMGSERTNPFVSSGLKKKLAVKISSFLDGFIFQTEGSSKYYPEGLRKKACIVPNAFFGDINTNIKYKNRDNVICATGRLVKSKRYDLIIKAFNIVNKKHPEYILKIYGTGDQKNDIQNLIKELNLEKSVVLMGVCNNINEELCKNKFFILTSDYEGMPNGLIEAMACGCACISRNCDFGPSEIIDNNKDGVLINSDSERDFANVLIKLIENENLAEKFSKNAILKVKEKFNKEKVAEKFFNYVKKVVNK